MRPHTRLGSSILATLSRKGRGEKEGMPAMQDPRLRLAGKALHSPR